MTVTAFTNAHVVPVESAPFDGVLLVEDGRITALGADVEVPAGADVVDCGGRWLLPGFVDAHVHLGMHAEGGVGSTADVNEMTDTVMAGVRAIDAIDPNEPGWRDALAGGVTTVNVNPGSGNPIGGQAVALHTQGRTVDEMVLRSPSGVKSALGENPKNVYREKGRTPSTRLGTALVIRRAFMDEQARAQGYENTTCAADMALLLATLRDGGLLPFREMRYAFELLGGQQHTVGATALLPDGVVHASKPGDLRGMRHDAAVIETGSGAWASVAVLATGLEDTRYGQDYSASVLPGFNAIGEAVHAYLQACTASAG